MRAARLRRGDRRPGRARRWRRSASWPTPASSGSPTTASPVASASILRNALAYAGALGLPIVDHPEDAALTDGAEANDGFVATVLGLRGWPAAAEEAAVARDLAILAEVVRDVPGARLHLTHLSTAGALDLVRRAKAAGLPVTCDVTPHHLALTDEWVAGARRWAWDASGDPWRDGAMRASAVRLVAAGQPAAPGARRRRGRPGRPCRRHRRRDRDRPRAAHRGRQGRRVRGRGERDQRHRDGARPAPRGRRRRQLPLARAIEALTTGPARVLAGRSRRNGSVGLVEGAPADLVVFDRSDSWPVTAEGLASRGKNSPLLGRELPGRVLVTIAGGRLAYEAPEA